ncbi:unnamed protein product [marine sediment metagenome]|uniref:Uncharacterized protein n=1 Tax=marine sediment metagenome TaxID=412755 RepID=X0VI20_9ZZZZ
MPKQVYEGIIVIFAKANISLYLGIHQHLGTQDTGGMGGIDSAPLKAEAMKASLNDYILFSVNTTAYFMPFS